jgi:hypothetical protein
VFYPPLLQLLLYRRHLVLPLTVFSSRLSTACSMDCLRSSTAQGRIRLAASCRALTSSTLYITACVATALAASVQVRIALQLRATMQRGCCTAYAVCNACTTTVAQSAVHSLPCRYSSLAQASAPDLRQLMASGRSSHLPGSPGGAAELLVQRSASSASMGKAFSR